MLSSSTGVSSPSIVSPRRSSEEGGSSSFSLALAACERARESSVCASSICCSPRRHLPLSSASVPAKAKCSLHGAKEVLVTVESVADQTTIGGSLSTTRNIGLKNLVPPPPSRPCEEKEADSCGLSPSRHLEKQEYGKAWEKFLPSGGGTLSTRGDQQGETIHVSLSSKTGRTVFQQGPVLFSRESSEAGSPQLSAVDFLCRDSGRDGEESDDCLDIPSEAPPHCQRPDQGHIVLASVKEGSRSVGNSFLLRECGNLLFAGACSRARGDEECCLSSSSRCSVSGVLSSQSTSECHGKQEADETNLKGGTKFCKRGVLGEERRTGEDRGREDCGTPPLPHSSSCSRPAVGQTFDPPPSTDSRVGGEQGSVVCEAEKEDRINERLLSGRFDVDASYGESSRREERERVVKLGASEIAGCTDTRGGADAASWWWTARGGG